MTDQKFPPGWDADRVKALSDRLDASAQVTADDSATTLSDIAHGRSGDKGDHANVAVLAYTRAGFDWLRDHLTAAIVARYFAPLGPTKVERFEAANLLGLNFVLHDVLAGGASRSPRIDTQGKTLALALLRMPITIADIESMRRERKEPS